VTYRDEDRILLKIVDHLGKKWTSVRKILWRKTPNNCESRFHRLEAVLGIMTLEEVGFRSSIKRTMINLQWFFLNAEYSMCI
jgi:hypothetical protein